MTVVTTVDPRNGRSLFTGLHETDDAELASALVASAAAFEWLRGLSRHDRADLLDRIAAELESRRAELVAFAESETGLTRARLDGELTRAAFQFRLFGEVLREGGYLEAAIDHVAQTPLGPAPDLRRMLVPLGPVAVFGASNFPFAFSVAGGDTASALAAGCPVVVKAHPSHPLTSQLSAETIAAAISAHSGPPGVLTVVYGQEAGLALVRHPGVRAAALTGSTAAARAIQSAIDERDEPIPFYGELSSVNPIVVLPAAAAARAEQIAAGLFASFTGSGGQLCTKPGLAFVPSGPAGDRLVGSLRDQVAAADSQVLLNARIRDTYVAGGERLVAAGAQRTARAANNTAAGFVGAPTLLELDLERFGAEHTEECFGPLLVVVRYADAAKLEGVLSGLPGSLTGSIHAEPADDRALVRRVVDVLAAGAGRIVFDGYPTGLRVSWAQHHGGPWPATNSVHTSVGATAIRRFLRPLAWQDAPEWILPDELAEGFDAIPRRVDGALRPGHHS
ncbi:aldehyde dehydrogenase (NADP(+)) [Asanoa sp. NPDC049518]|uniref:aldehyde dehydrogenase (NADP(+)) n=1 Tax=unclassified Asanoa TaxID=2685164 RepID=UPI003449D4E9